MKRYVWNVWSVFVVHVVVILKRSSINTDERHGKKFEFKTSCFGYNSSMLEASAVLSTRSEHWIPNMLHFIRKDLATAPN